MRKNVLLKINFSSLSGKCSIRKQNFIAKYDERKEGSAPATKLFALS
jgi:hypothetical protein